MLSQNIVFTGLYTLYSALYLDCTNSFDDKFSSLSPGSPLDQVTVSQTSAHKPMTVSNISYLSLRILFPVTRLDHGVCSRQCSDSVILVSVLPTVCSPHPAHDPLSSVIIMSAFKYYYKIYLTFLTFAYVRAKACKDFTDRMLRSTVHGTPKITN